MQDAPATPSTTLATDREEESGLRRLLRAFRSRNYRLFFIGQGVSLLGSWIGNVATAWLVYRLSKEGDPAKSAALLGIVGFATQAPLFFLSPFTGVLVDRWPRRTIMVITQAMSMLQSTAMAVLTLMDVITIPQVIVLAIVQGIVNAFDVPARQTFVVEMVEDRHDLPNAIALNSMMFNSARLVGPAVAGVLIAVFGEGLCFAIDAFSYFAVIVSLLAMRFVRPLVQREPKSVLHELQEGFAYSFGFPPTRSLLLLAGIFSFMGSSLAVLLPIFADMFSHHQHGERYLGFLSSGIGLGALAGGTYLASRKTVVGLGRVVMYSTAGYGIALILFTQTMNLLTGLPALVLCGFCFMVTLASTNTMLQSMVDDDKRGRLMSFFSMMVMGMSPLGSLLAGYVAAQTSVRVAVIGAGAACLLTGLWFGMKLPSLRPLVRPIYVRKGIIKEISEGMHAAEVPGAEEK